ncbi:hypothetical protein MCEMSEM23_00101 [Rhabdaerophilaceae bacterium]
MLPKILSLVLTVLLLGWMFYFFVGTLPLLILKHEDPADWRMVRGFFNIHYLVLMGFAVLDSFNSILAGRIVLGSATACIALFGFIARTTIVPRMDGLRTTLGGGNVMALRSFRRLHIVGLALNILVLASFVTALSLASGEIVTCGTSPPGCNGAECRVLCSLL